MKLTITKEHYAAALNNKKSSNYTASRCCILSVAAKEALGPLVRSCGRSVYQYGNKNDYLCDGKNPLKVFQTDEIANSLVRRFDNSESFLDSEFPMTVELTEKM